MKFGRLLWGLIILFIGVILLGVNFGWWDSSVWNSVFDLWPLFLVVLGIAIVFGNNSPVALILLLIVVLFSILYVSDYRNIRGRIGKETGASSVSRDFSADLDPLTRNAEIEIKLGAADITLGSENNESELYTGSFSSENGIQTKTSQNGDKAKISFSEEASNFHWNSKNRRDFFLNLNKSVVYKLNVDSGASKLNLDLESLKVEELDINAGASTSDIRVGKELEKVEISIDAGASKTKLLLPKDYAISVKSDSALVTNNYDEIGLKKDGKVWKSDDFGSNSKQINLEISAGASTINIERY